MAAKQEAHAAKHWYDGPAQHAAAAAAACSRSSPRSCAPIVGAHYYTGEIMWPLVIGGYSGAALAFTAALFWDRHSRLQDEVRQTEADRRRTQERLQQEQERRVVEAKRRFGALEVELTRLKASIERTKREQAQLQAFLPGSADRLVGGGERSARASSSPTTS